jgi:predicted MFS family arabinose efflux permease
VRRLAAGLLLSRTGDQLTTIALLWFVLDLTGSGAAVGLVLLCAGPPPVVTGPLLGRLLDRWSPRRVMVADNLLRAVLVGAVPALHWLGRLDMPVLYGLSAAAGSLIPATDVGVRVVLPRLVDEDELERANALLSIGDQVSALVGPACGGPLVGLVGAPPVLLLDAVSFLAMAALALPLPDPPLPDRPPGPPLPGPPLPGPWATAALRPPGRATARRAALGDPAVRVVLAVTLVYFLAYGPLEPALPVYSHDVLDAGAGGYGLLWSAFGAGALAGLATIPLVGRLRPGVALAENALAWGAALLPLLVVTGIAPAMLASPSAG